MNQGRLKAYRSFTIEKKDDMSLLDSLQSVTDSDLSAKQNELTVQNEEIDSIKEETKMASEEELDLESYQQMKMDYLDRLEMATQQSQVS